MGSRNAGFIMQNGILGPFSNMVRRDIIEEGKQSEVFSIIANGKGTETAPTGPLLFL